MIEILIYLLPLIPVLYLLLIRIKLFNKNFSLTIFDGLFLGGVIFILIPLILVILNDKLEISDFDIKYSFSVEKDTDTYLYCIFSLTLIAMVSNLARGKKSLERYTTYLDKKIFVCFLILYLFGEIVFFIKSGKISGDSHWYGANQEVFEQGSFFVLIAQFHNVGRVVLPGLLLLFHLRNPSKSIIKLHLTVTIVILFVELVLTGNRIAMLFQTISLLIPFIAHKNYKYVIFLSLFSIPAIKIAEIWPMVRGLIWTQSISVNHISYVFNTALKTSERKIKKSLNDNFMITLTEGSNLIFLNYVINTYPDKVDFLLGETLILKSFGAIIPKSIWSTKPDGIGLRVGRNVSYTTKGLTLNTTILGDAWANFGYLGIIFILFILNIVKKIYEKKINYSTYSFMLFMVSLASWRFDFSFYFISIITIEIMIYISNLSFLSFLFHSFIKVLFHDDI